MGTLALLPLHDETLPHIGDVYSAECPCRDILDLVGSKWSALVIGRLEATPLRFGELRRRVPGITQKMLTQALRLLERDGLVNRRVLVEKHPPQVEYSLTEVGSSVTEPLGAIRDWSQLHPTSVLAPRRRFDAAEA